MQPSSCTNRHPNRQARGPADIFSGPLHGCLLDTTSYTYNQAGDVTSIQDAEDAGTTSANHRPAVLRYNDMQELTTAWTDDGTQDPAPTNPNPGGIGGCTNPTPAASAIGGPAPYWSTSANLRFAAQHG